MIWQDLVCCLKSKRWNKIIIHSTRLMALHMPFQIIFLLRHCSADNACVIDSLFFTFTILNMTTFIRFLGKFLLAVQPSKHSIFCFILNNLLECWSITFPFVSSELLFPSNTLLHPIFLHLHFLKSLSSIFYWSIKNKASKIIFHIWQVFHF